MSCYSTSETVNIIIIDNIKAYYIFALTLLVQYIQALYCDEALYCDITLSWRCL